MSIRRKYQVFISSTKKDLSDERLKVFEAVAQMGCIPAGMENFPTGEKSMTLIENEIDESDIYILITAGCYGSIPRGRTWSYTEREYEYAKRTGKEILIFMIEDIEKLPGERIDKKRKKIDAFRDKLLNSGYNVAFWYDEASLVSAVKQSLGIKVKKMNSGGWLKIFGDVSDAQAEALDEYGLQRIFRTRAEKNNESDPLLESHAIKQLDGIAFGLRSFRSIRTNDVIENLNNGMHMRLLVMNPDSPYAKQRAIEEGENPDSISNSIKNLIEWVKDTKERSTAGSIEIKIYDTMTLDFYWRIDDFIYVGPYFYGVPSQQTLTYKYSKPGKCFDFYSSYFEDLWNNTKLCHYPD